MAALLIVMPISLTCSLLYIADKLAAYAYVEIELGIN